MKIKWTSEYSDLADSFLKIHFGTAQNVTRHFPCMRDEYPWGSHRPEVVDSRVPAKNNTEYHGFENLAMQYHATAQYEFAYHHWVLAADWRHDDMTANNFTDEGHKTAITFALQHAEYNRALSEWQEHKNEIKHSLPTPEMFGLKSEKVDAKEREAIKKIADSTSLK